MKRRFSFLSAGALALAVLLEAGPAPACTRAGPFSFDELFAADVIVRAKAARYVVPPDPKMRTTGVPDSTVEFEVEEVLKGEGVPEKLELHAYLGDEDDFNELKVPYTFVRPGGRSGSCFANTYKKGAQFLLFLKKRGEGYTPNISALGPTNEQLRGPDDEWLRWVRDYLKGREGAEGRAPLLSGAGGGVGIWLSLFGAV